MTQQRTSLLFDPSRFVSPVVAESMARRALTVAAGGCASPRQIDRRANHQFRFSEVVSSAEIKNISLLQKSNREHIDCHPGPGRGALAIVTNEGRVAVDAGVATDERG
jgi:hypothetical protein